MFEFMYAKKIKTDTVMEIIEKYKDDYNMFITHKPNGTLEIFIGSKKNTLCRTCDNHKKDWTKCANCSVMM